jgi:hypothetical protein
MRSSSRAAVPLAVVAALIAAAPAAADSRPAPKAEASGGDVVELIYPSIVRVRLARTERALDRATEKFENGTPADAASPLKVVRRQMAAAWRGAKYVIRTTPPPPPAEDLTRPRARKSGGAPVGPTYASPPDTAFAVLSLQHDVSSAVAQLIDGAHGTSLNALATTLNLANDRRDQALRYILSVAPPAPPAEDLARTSQEEGAVPTFDTVMPNLGPQLDDELQAIEGTKSDATDLTAGGRRLLNAAATQIAGTKAFVNTNWPLVPAED